jgi:integrase
MGRAKEILNAKQIQNAKPKEKEFKLADGGGLYLMVKPSGTKVWLFNYYRPYTRKRANLILDKYPDLGLSIARDRRRAYANLLANNIDPQEHEREQHQAHQQKHAANFERVALNWLDTRRKKVTADYADDIERSLQNHAFPKLGKFPIANLTAQQVIEALKPVEAKGSLETLRRLCQRINLIMIWATNTGIIHHNPLQGIAKAFDTPTVKNQPTLKPAELPELMQSLQRASIKFTTRCLIEWQLHTMTRPSEAAGARWDEIDEVNKLWTIPAERMKMRRDHAIPLTEQTLSLLDEMKPISGANEFIFSGDRNPSKPTNSETANMALKRMGFKGRLVAHGLRSLASTTLNEQGFDPDAIEAALAHTDKDAVRAAYNRSDYLQRRRLMMQSWSEHIELAAQGSFVIGKGKRNLKVVQS